MTDQVLVRIYMSEEDPTKCPPLHRWSSCHPHTSDGLVCLATGKCPVCPVTFWATPGHCPPLLGWAPMEFRWKCPISVPPVLSDYLPVAPITLLLVTYQHHLCVANWNVSDQYPTKLIENEKSAFRPVSVQPPASVEGGHNRIGKFKERKRKRTNQRIHRAQFNSFELLMGENRSINQPETMQLARH